MRVVRKHKNAGKRGVRAAAVAPYLSILGASLLAVFVWSRINPREVATWWLEVMPVIIGVPLLAATYPRFPLTPLAYILIWMHAVILMVGGHYTYAEVPLFNWIRDAFGLARNHYDRVGHFAQGFVPAILAREVLLRTSPLRPGRWLFFLVCCVCLAISAVYELIEWWAALLTSPETGTAFLGTQGDAWDTQWDMALALVGSILSQIVLGRLHDAQLRRRPAKNAE
jgi:putative membrane protein